MARANEDTLAELHEAVAQDLLNKLKSGEATAQELSAAIKFLKDNNITTIIDRENTTGKLLQFLPKFDDEDEDQAA
ncbi:ABC-type Zn uptake system ZnuABC Zn-binding protein ZnuA [Rhodoblastus acidophilus]|uniref:hypothetical protein n=1 Tax=Rhodoblastus acidophilus TaxID=1074 RepID=UPI002223F121|nr:hypothetical protein [Rhodoblastus acidophilus]MCW2286854.1 ABC-type Zn uptake system ZnuABC Zn-binding protein ZnuA [Rhodoblastus acidophilus]MCW2335712.1 ABC-type Zn uptake system ZnuABC Zn-binding protein ZnuA [Rhodoblastus acidophilus]